MYLLLYYTHGITSSSNVAFFQEYNNQNVALLCCCSARPSAIHMFIHMNCSKCGLYEMQTSKDLFTPY